MRGLGSSNVDFRLRQADFAADGKMAGAPWLGMDIAEVSQLDRVLVVGSTLRKDHPLIAHRLRQSAKKLLKISILHSVDDDLLMRVAHKAIVAPAAMVELLAQVVQAAAVAKNVAVPEIAHALVASVTVTDAAQRIASSLADGKDVAVFLGNFAQHHAQASQLHALAQALAEIIGGRLGFLGEAANSVGGYVVNAMPSSSGANAGQMIANPLKAYVLLGVEPELELHDPRLAVAAMQQAELVVALSAYQHKAVDYAQVLLPIAPFTETVAPSSIRKAARKVFRAWCSRWAKRVRRGRYCACWVTCWVLRVLISKVLTMCASKHWLPIIKTSIKTISWSRFISAAWQRIQACNASLKRRSMRPMPLRVARRRCKKPAMLCRR